MTKQQLQKTFWMGLFTATPVVINYWFCPNFEKEWKCLINIKEPDIVAINFSENSHFAQANVIVMGIMDTTFAIDYFNINEIAKRKFS